MKKISMYLFLCFVMFSLGARAAGREELATKARDLVKAIFEKNEAAAKYTGTAAFWNRQGDSLKEIYSIGSNPQMASDLSLPTKVLGVESDRGVVQMDMLQKSTNKVKDTLYLYAKIDGDLWVFIGWNESLNDVTAFLKGTVPASFK